MMAQHKYDLITVPVEPQGPPRHHPWYKERLALKYLQTFRPSASLEGGRWAFLPGNIDDCRTGVPVQTQGGRMVVKANPVPLIDSRSAEMLAKDKRRRRTQPTNIHSNPGRHTLYSKVGPRRQAHRASYSKVEQSLLAHPLGLYPHLEESLPPEMLEDVVGLLDPDLKLTETEVGSELLDSLGSLPGGHGVQQQQQQQAGTEKQEKSEGNDESPPAQTGIYRWPLRQTEEEKERERSLLAIQKVISPTQESRVNQVTHNLVQWGRDLGGTDEKYYMDEATVKRLFSSDYETRPVLTVPIHVVELVNVPPELAQVHSAPSWSYPGERRRRRRRRAATVPGMEMEQPRHVQTRYGAWYLPTNLWRVRPWDEPLQDPREEAVGMESEALVRSLAMDKVLTDLHGARAFKEFISTHRPHTTMPKFLRNVSKTPKQLTGNGKSTAVS